MPRGARVYSFSSLELVAQDGPQEPAGSTSLPVDSHHRIVLVDDIPFLHDYQQVQRFRDILRNHMSVARVPVVLMQNTSDDPSSFLPAGTYSLLSPDMMSSPNVGHIKCVVVVVVAT